MRKLNRLNKRNGINKIKQKRKSNDKIDEIWCQW